MAANISVPKLSYTVVAKTEVAITRPAIERARFRCECCPADTGLRVVIGLGETIVLCLDCRTTNGFELVFAQRRRVRQFAERLKRSAP